MAKNIIDVYLETGDFHKACDIAGMWNIDAHLELLRSGVLKIQDKIEYGTLPQQLGGKAEELFQKLVPEAVDANKFWKKNNPVYDFCYKGIYIDVKYSSLSTRDNNWKIKTSKADFICAFLEWYKGQELNKPYILLIHKNFIPDDKKCMYFNKTSRLFKICKVEEETLNLTLDKYLEVLQSEKRS